MFATKQLAKAQLNGYKKHLLGKATIPPHDKVLDATKDAEEIKNRDLNDMAYANLLLSMEDDTAWNLVNNAKSTELPDGDAALAWTKLNVLGSVTRVSIVRSPCKLIVVRVSCMIHCTQ